MTGKIYTSEKGQTHLCDPGVGRLLGAWLTAGRGGRMPGEVDVRRIPEDLRPKVFVCQLDDDADITLSYVGSEVAGFLEDAPGGEADGLDAVLQDYADVIAKRQPICTYVSEGSASRPDYERLLLPLSSDGATIDGLLGGLFIERH